LLGREKDNRNNDGVNNVNHLKRKAEKNVKTGAACVAVIR
jgi:hypothetical protein